MHVWKSLLAASAIALAGCGLVSQGQPEPQATQDAIGTAAALTVAAILPTAAPSSTPVPTLPPAASPTAEASAIPTEGPTATPSAPPTPDPNLHVTDTVLYEDSFDGKSGWFWTFEDDVVAFGAVEGELRVQAKQGKNTWRYVLRDDITAGDMQLTITARALACPANDEYGLMFRGRFDAQATIETYLLTLNCAGQIRLAVLDNTDVIPLRDWESFSALKTEAPAENRLLVWMAKDQIHVFANDQFLFTLGNAGLLDGFFGFYVRTYSGGGGQFVFDDMVVREVAAP